MLGAIWLQSGSRGADVEDLQRLLNIVAIPFVYQGKTRTSVVVDGKYGPETAAAVMGVQNKADLPLTGAFDDDTREALLAFADQVDPAKATNKPAIKMKPINITGTPPKSSWWAWVAGGLVALKLLG